MSYFGSLGLAAQGYLGSWGNCFGSQPEEGASRQPSCLSKYTYGVVKTAGELPVCLATTAFCVSGVWYGVCAGQTSYAIGSCVLAGGTTYSWYELRQFAHLQGFDTQNGRFEDNNQALEGNIKGLVAAVKSVQEMDRSLTEGIELQEANNEAAAENNQTLQEKLEEMGAFVQQLFDTKKEIKEDRDIIQAEVVRIKSLVKQMVVNANATRSAHEGLSGEVDELDESNEDLEENIAKLENFQGSLAGTYQRIKGEREQLSQEVDELQLTEAGLDQGVKKFRETERKLEETEHRLAEALSQLDSLKELADLVPALTRLANTAPPAPLSLTNGDSGAKDDT